MASERVNLAPGKGRGVLQWIAEAERPWVKDAACMGMDTDFFYDEGNAQNAKKFCQQCPVKDPCLDEALSMSRVEDQGVRGGMSQKQRIQERVRRRKARRASEAAA